MQNPPLKQSNRQKIYNAGSNIKIAKPSILAKSLKVAISDEFLIAHWTRQDETRENWGDALNPVLLELLSGRKVVHSRDIVNLARKPVYAVLGSILGGITSTQTEVWGAGFIRDGSQIRVRPKKVHAVRGPLTRSRLLQLGIECPEIYGDPAILYERFYRPNPEVVYDLGLIPHYSDVGSPHLARFAEDESVNIIDITAGIHEVIDEVMKCRYIASSSLHGLIIADSYGLPAVWIKITDALFGGDFKFQDYLGSIGDSDMQPVDITEQTTTTSLIDRVREVKSKIDIDQLLSACPFMQGSEANRGALSVDN